MPGLRGVTATRSLTTADVIMYALILSLGSLMFGLCQRNYDFVAGDTIYRELARSVIEKRFYGYNFTLETVFPPGFPAILAVICVTAGCTHLILVRSMAVFATLGLIASYELLRREEGRVLAAAVCLFLGSSPEMFSLATQLVMSDLPYFLSSTLALLLATRLDTANDFRGRAALWLLFCSLLSVSLMIRSAGVSLLSGLIAWLAASSCVDRKLAWRRLSTFLPALILGLLVQGAWMHWTLQNATSEWPVGSYPGPSYISQVELKDGRDPELGMASLKDVLVRVKLNATERVAMMTTLASRKWVHPVLVSPAVLVPLLLMLLGIGSSLWRTGGRFYDWYFVSYEVMYLLWPWPTEFRFLLPTAPLAGLYIWRGVRKLLHLAPEKGRPLSALCFSLSVLLATYSGVSGRGLEGLQAKLSPILWACLAAISAWIGLAGWRRLSPLKEFLWCSRAISSIAGRSLTLQQIAGIGSLAALVGVGLAMQIEIGRDNLAFELTKGVSYPYIEGAAWIQSHTVGTAVVMARKVDVVYHYSGRKVVWLPPISNPSLLMDGIRKYNVNMILVTDSKYSYWTPTEQDSFEGLVSTYPGAFHLVHEGPEYRIFEVTSRDVHA